MTKTGYDISVSKIYRDTFNALAQNPTILALFLLIGLFDLLGLFALFMAHSEPFASIFGPIIRAFWGSRFLHYPDNFLLLPKLSNLAHLFLLGTFGILFSGIVIKKLEAWHCGKKLHTAELLFPVIKKYFGLALIWLVTFAIYSTLIKRVLPLISVNSPWVQLAIGYLLGLAAQALFAYLIPAILLNTNGYWKNVILGFKMGFKYMGLTIGLIAFPILLIAIVSIFKLLTPYFVSIAPEIVLGVLTIGLVVSTAVDLFVTTSTVLLFLKVRQIS